MKLLDTLEVDLFDLIASKHLFRGDVVAKGIMMGDDKHLYSRELVEGYVRYSEYVDSLGNFWITKKGVDKIPPKSVRLTKISFIDYCAIHKPILWKTKTTSLLNMTSLEDSSGYLYNIILYDVNPDRLRIFSTYKDAVSYYYDKDEIERILDEYDLGGLDMNKRLELLTILEIIDGDESNK